MGSAAFAVPSLEALVESGHDVELVVTQCDKPAGRGLKVHACPVAAYAGSKGIPLFQPLKLKDGNAAKRLAEIRPDIIVVVAYGKLIPNDILSLPKFSCINVHASLLPKYRGAAPINWAVVNGEERTGVTTMVVSERMDAGDLLLQEEVELGPAETAIELHDRLSIIGANLLIETVEGLKNKTIRPAPQDEGLVTHAPILKKEDGAIDWKRSAKEIFDLIRGMQPWPVAYTHIDRKMLKIFMAAPHPHPPPSRGTELQTIPSPLVREGQGEGKKAPGTIVIADKNLAVATGKGTLYLTDVQLEGKKRMPIEAFLRGHKIKVVDIHKK